MTRHPSCPRKRASSAPPAVAALALALALGACATLPPALPEVAACQANYRGFDAKADAADVRDGGAYSIPGFPYLRVDRFLASFRDEAADGAKFDVWVERMRALDLTARAAELRNIGWDDPSEEVRHLERCGKAWAARDLASPQRRAQLREAARVPDDYSWLKRALGFYPVAVPFLNMGINGFNDDVRDDYARPVAALEAPGPLVLWASRRSPAPYPGSGLANAGRDPLGIPQLTREQWQALAEFHKPTWLIETGGDYDRPGAVVLSDGVPTVNAEMPVTYFLPAYTRFGGKVLAQLVYVVWFSERPKDGGFDWYGGALDGIVWRVTLDEHGGPLLYDTIHPCGCYHYYFTAGSLKRKQQGGFWDEPVLFPQGGPEGRAPAPLFAIRVQSGTHYVRRLVPLEGLSPELRVATETRQYALRDYDELLSLPDGEGGTRSLFCEDGLVCGTERLERFWLWPAGIRSAGAMRQWGRHATSFVGRSHFDDPGLLDRLFEAR